MGGTTLTLDTILSATFHFTTKWSSDLQSNKARDLLRYLVCRIYDEGRGQLMNTQLTLAQTTLAQKLDMSRQWVGELVSRLNREGWIEHEAPKLPDGTNGSTMFRAGRMLKRLVVMLLKSRQRKSPTKLDAKNPWHFSPLRREKEILSILNKEKEPPKPEILERIPLLKQWMERGKTK
jgi:Mn-dependent DtxR family transcriptional regulator